MHWAKCFLAVSLVGLPAFPAQHYEASGLVLHVDVPRQTITVSEDEIPGFMEAMIMSYRVRDKTALTNLHTGTNISFTLVVEKQMSYLSAVRVRKFDSMARDPVQVRTLNLLESAMEAEHTAGKELALGQAVPDFTLLDQNKRPIKLSDYYGKAIAVTFVYTRCPLPDYCFRLSNNFGQLQKRFRQELGKQLIFLSISFDPVHDAPEVLAKYAAIWKAQAEDWHFLTGPLAEVKRVCSLFGMSFWPDEGLLTHSLHTVLIDQEGRLYANLEGNEFTPKQLGDLLNTLLHTNDKADRK